MAQPSYKVFLNQKEPTGPWKDDRFPANDSSLIGSRTENRNKIKPSDVEWKRASEIFPQPCLFENKINAENFVQGKISDYYLLSSLTALCQYPGLITQIFLTKEYNPDGYYKLLLFIDGEFQILFVDDYFPCLKGTNIPFFLKPNNFELWAMLLEKAWAKLNKGYANILNGWPCDIFKTFTGFSCEYINLQEENEQHLWPTIRFIERNSGLICLSTKDEDEVNKIGLLKNQTYNLVETLEMEDENGNVTNICKLRNYWEKSDWSGDWSEKSEQWKKNINLQGRKKNDDEIFISITDILKYFCRVDLSQLICDGYSKTFDLKEKESKGPQVFNFFLRTQGNVSISIVDKNWRFHRELTNMSHPTSLVLAEYDPALKVFKNVYCDFNCFDDCEKTRTLNSGFYVLWVFKVSASAEEALAMKLKICSESKISIKHIGLDKDFEIIKSIIYHSVKFMKKEEIKNDEIFYDYSNDFNGSGLAYRLIINPLFTKYQKWTINNPKSSKNYLILPFLKEGKDDKINFEVGPNNFNIIIAIKTNNYGTFCFNLSSEVEQYECREGEDPVQDKKVSFDSFCTSDVSQIEPLADKETKSLEEYQKKEKFPVIDHWRVFAEKYNVNSNVKEAFLALKPQEGNKKLGWVVLKLNNGTYIGEAEYLYPQGRGCMLYKDGMTFVGYFDKGTKANYGKLFNKEGVLLYDGEYKKCIRNGNGTFYYPGGLKYVGEFENGIREGKGIFYWDDGTYWNGTFKDNEMDGEGIYFDGENSFTVAYKNGDIVEE